jgi:hypothetical protein
MTGSFRLRVLSLFRIINVSLQWIFEALKSSTDVEERLHIHERVVSNFDPQTGARKRPMARLTKVVEKLIEFASLLAIHPEPPRLPELKSSAQQSQSCPSSLRMTLSGREHCHPPNGAQLHEFNRRRLIASPEKRWRGCARYFQSFSPIPTHSSRDPIEQTRTVRPFTVEQSSLTNHRREMVAPVENDQNAHPAWLIDRHDPERAYEECPVGCKGGQWLVEDGNV